MATAYSDEVAPGGSQWNRIRVKCDYSGTSATITIQFRRTQAYSSRWYDSQASITFNGQTKSAPYDYSGTVGTSWIDLDSASGFTIPTSGGTFSWSFNNPGGGAVLQCSGTIYIGSQAQKPSGGHMDNVSSYYANGNLRIACTAIGVNDGGAALTQLIMMCGDRAYTESGLDNQYKRQMLAVNNAPCSMSNYDFSGAGYLWLKPNMTIYLGIYAENSVGDYRCTSSVLGSIVTVPGDPGTPWVTGANDTPTTKQLGVYFPENGGVYTQTWQYRLNGGSWTNGITKTGTSGESKYITLSGLTPGTNYTMETRVASTAGTTVGGTLNFRTLDYKHRLYGSVSSAATHVNKLYCRPGTANWFNKNGSRFGFSSATYTVSGEDIIVTGNSTAGSYKWGMVPIKGTDGLIGKQITVSFDMKVGGSYTSDIRIFWCNSTDTGYTSLVDNTDNIQTTNGQFRHVVKTFTVPSRPSGSGNLALAFYSNVSSVASGTTTFRNVMVKLGGDTDFIPYNGTPTGDNLYDLGGYLDNQTSFTVTNSGASFTLNGTNSGGTRCFLGTIYLPAGTYTAKNEYISGSNSGIAFWVYQDQTWTRPFTDNLSVSSSTTSKTKTFTTTAAATYHLAAYANAGVTADNFTARFAIYKGSTASDFSAYTNYPGALPVYKLYGSVNGKARLIHMRHTDKPSGRVM